MKEISAVTGVSVDTLERRFLELIRGGRETGRASLRRYQWNLAQKGNPAMLIWLGKQLLEQRDKVDNDNTNENKGVTEVKIIWNVAPTKPGSEEQEYDCPPNRPASDVPSEGNP